MGVGRRTIAGALAVGLLPVVVAVASVPTPAHALPAIHELRGPTGSNLFGSHITALPNGNVVVTDPWYSTSTATQAGAVYLYNGATRSLISMLTGSAFADEVGVHGVTVLANGNFVVKSPSWSNGASLQVGAATWVDAFHTERGDCVDRGRREGVSVHISAHPSRR